jgi:hypothetical protein
VKHCAASVFKALALFLGDVAEQRVPDDSKCPAVRHANESAVFSRHNKIRFDDSLIVMQLLLFFLLLARC